MCDSMKPLGILWKWGSRSWLNVECSIARHVPATLAAVGRILWRPKSPIQAHKLKNCWEVLINLTTVPRVLLSAHSIDSQYIMLHGADLRR